MSQRINYIDRMKGLAILLVVMGHIYLFSMGKSDCVLYRFIGSFHMCFFMFLSGLVVASGISSPFWSMKKLMKKIIALIVPMFVFGLIFTMSLGEIDSCDTFLHKFLTFINAPEKAGYWYLMSLSMFYLSLQLFRLNRWNNYLVDILIACITFVLFFIGWKYTAQKYDPFCLLDCGNNYLAFIFGVFSTKYGLIEKIINNNWCYTVSFIGYIVLFGYVCPVSVVNSLLKHVIVPLFAIVVILTVFIRRENDNSIIERCLEFLGKQTLDIYILHYFLIVNLNFVVIDRWFQETGNFILSGMFVFMVSLLIAYITIGFGYIIHKSSIIEKIVYGKL